jgi:hypothetical protein
MPPPPVIADVSETLRSVITAGLSGLFPGPPVAVVTNLQTAPGTNPPVLAIFLYDVIEDPSARNRPAARRRTPPDVEILKPPMALLLRYMLTPFSPDARTDQQILGQVMQTLYDGAILSGPQLAGSSLKNTAEALKITLTTISLYDRALVWQAFAQPFRVSLAYEVRVVNLDSTVSQHVRPVSERDVDSTLPESTT